MSVRVPTPEEIRAWPVTIDVPSAGRAFGIGRDESYRLAREGRFPVQVLHLGRYLRVARASVLNALSVSEYSLALPTPHSADSPSPWDDIVNPETDNRGYAYDKIGITPIHCR